MAFHYSPKITTNGLVFAVDAKNPNSQVSGGTITYNLKDKGISGAHSASGMADGDTLTFDGASDYIDFDSIVPIVQNDTVGSVEIWCRTSDSTPSAFGYIFSVNRTDNLPRQIFSLGITVGGNAHFQAIFNVITSDRVVLSTDNKVFEDNTWHQFVATQEGDFPRIYFDGVLVPQTIAQGDVNQQKYWFNDLTTIDNSRIACTKNQGQSESNFFNGDVSNVKVYNRALTASEVSQNYNTLKTRFGH